MPSRSFYRPPDFKHLEAIQDDLSDENLVARFLEFEKLGVAPLINEGSLAHSIGISSKLLFSIILRKGKHYRRFKLLKKSGAPRDIATPRTYLKVIQWWILDNILAVYDQPVWVTGFVRGRSPISNAEAHIGSRHLLSMDLADFFPSVTEEMVLSWFLHLGYEIRVASQLAELTTLDGKLPQGAPTSPALANHCARMLDLALVKLSEQNNFRFTRYADDLSFSSQDHIPEAFAVAVEQEVVKFGFRVNARKTRFKGTGDRLEVTGYVINSKIQLPREWRNKVRGFAKRALRNPVDFITKLDKLIGYSGALQATQSADGLKQLVQSAVDAVRRERDAQAAIQ